MTASAGPALVELGVREAAARIAAGELSPVALLEAYLERIPAADERLNAFRTVTAEAARGQAREAEAAVARGAALGPLHGVPVAVKDNIEVAGVRRTAGTTALPARLAERDAPVAGRLRAAGALIVGTCHLSEWAIGATNHNVHFGPARNPWDPERSPGGSSGGSAAAVAADLVPAALGTDTGGSVRIPAGWTGICGLRPTLGRVSARGVIPVSWTMDTIGPLARRAEDVAALLGVLAGYDAHDPVCEDVEVDDYVAGLTGGVQGLRVGYLGGEFRERPDPAVAACVEQAARQLEALGAHVSDVGLPDLGERNELAARLMMAEAAHVHAERLAETPEVFAPDVRARLARGASVTGPEYGRGRQEQRRWRRTVLEALAVHDVLLGPTAPSVAPVLAESDPLQTSRLAHFTAAWGLAGVPVLSVPCGFADGLPVGLQLVGRPFAEATLLRAAHAYQAATGFHLRRPAALSPTAR